MWLETTCSKGLIAPIYLSSNNLKPVLCLDYERCTYRNLLGEDTTVRYSGEQHCP